MSEAPLLGMERVACLRGGRLLFEDMDLVLGPGEAALVTGPNGAGKSSLMRVAAGLLRAAAGVVERAPAALAEERLALGRALVFWTRLDGGDAEAGLEAMGIGHLAQVPVRILSTGQRKRAALARVVASGAPLWLLDEPANGLDTDGQDRLAAAMAEHRRRGGAVLAASHQPLGLEDAQRVILG